MDFKKLNETFTLVQGTKGELLWVSETLKTERPDAYFDPLVKRGFKSPFVYYSSKVPDGLIIYNGHLSLLNQEEPLSCDFTTESLKESLKEDLEVLPFKPYDFQLRVV